MPIEASTLIVLLLAVALAGALIGVLPGWRRMTSGSLPIRRHLHNASPPFDAKLRCALCAGRQECSRRAAPLADCPNAALFKKDDLSSA